MCKLTLHSELSLQLVLSRRLSLFMSFYQRSEPTDTHLAVDSHRPDDAPLVKEQFKIRLLYHKLYLYVNTPRQNNLKISTDHQIAFLNTSDHNLPILILRIAASGALRTVPVG